MKAEVKEPEVELISAEEKTPAQIVNEIRDNAPYETVATYDYKHLGRMLWDLWDKACAYQRAKDAGICRDILKKNLDRDGFSLTFSLEKAAKAIESEK